MNELSIRVFFFSFSPSNDGREIERENMSSPTFYPLSIIFTFFISLSVSIHGLRDESMEGRKRENWEKWWLYRKGGLQIRMDWMEVENERKEGNGPVFWTTEKVVIFLFLSPSRNDTGSRITLYSVCGSAIWTLFCVWCPYLSHLVHTMESEHFIPHHFFSPQKHDLLPPSHLMTFSTHSKS